jgi:hypothetical protein
VSLVGRGERRSSVLVGRGVVVIGSRIHCRKRRERSIGRRRSIHILCIGRGRRSIHHQLLTTTTLPVIEREEEYLLVGGVVGSPPGDRAETVLEYVHRSLTLR